MNDVFFERGLDVVLVIRLRESQDLATIVLCTATSEASAKGIADSINAVLRNADKTGEIQKK